MMSGRTFNALTRALGVLALFIGASGLQAQPSADEERVGELAAARILGAAPLLDLPAAQRYVNLVGATVAQRTEGGYKWRFGLVKTESVNAFATPGGFILVTTGLVKQLQSEDELAFVLAHEVGHVLKRHHYRVVQRQRLALW
jgi:predicted Zn-dependent protease